MEDGLTLRRTALPATTSQGESTINPYEFRYTASTYITTQGVSSSTDNGILMYYKANTPDAPNDPSPAAPGQLTEWTIRDQAFLTMVNPYDHSIGNGTIPASELTTLVNYDVSYVDDMTAPVAMNATERPRSHPVYSKRNSHHGRWNNDN